jgi:hypothetical protein
MSFLGGRTERAYRFGTSMFVAVAILALVVCASAAADRKKLFKNGKYPYSVEYPADWFLNSTIDRFEIVSFPPKDAVRAVLLPKGGATIVILVPRQIARSDSELPRTLDEWVGLGTKHQRIISRREVELETPAGTATAIEARTLCCAVPPFQEAVEWFFMTGGQYFEATVVYWQGEPNSVGREEVLRRIVRTLRVNTGSN